MVFRSCLPRYSSNTNQSISNENLPDQTDKFDDQDDSIECLSIISEENPTNPHSKENQSNKPTIRRKKRGPRYSRINKHSQSLMTRFIGTIFGNPQTPSKNKKDPMKKSILPSKSTLKKQFEQNEQTLNSFLTFLTRIESNIQVTPSIESEQSQNNNRIDDK